MHLETTYDRLTQFIECVYAVCALTRQTSDCCGRTHLRDNPTFVDSANIEAPTKRDDEHPLQQLLELFLTVSVLSPSVGDRFNWDQRQADGLYTVQSGECRSYTAAPNMGASSAQELYRKGAFR